MLQRVLEHLVTGIVDHPDDVVIRRSETLAGEAFEVRVNEEDLGRVIGRGGRIARHLRTLMNALGEGRKIYVNIDDRSKA